MKPYQKAFLRGLLGETNEMLRKLHELTRRTFPVGTRLEFTRRENGVRLVDRGRVTGYVHRWRLDLVITTDAGVRCTKVVSPGMLKDTRIL